jgi:FMN phosphatase YigB (HAD superfamily)
MDNKLTIAFDLQGTLINTETNEDQLAMIYLIKRLKKAGHIIMVWTGGYEKDIEKALEELNLTEYVDHVCTKRKPTVRPDIAFDDSEKAILLGEKATIII